MRPGYRVPFRYPRSAAGAVPIEQLHRAKLDLWVLLPWQSSLRSVVSATAFVSFLCLCRCTIPVILSRPSRPNCPVPVPRLRHFSSCVRVKPKALRRKLLAWSAQPHGRPHADLRRSHPTVRTQRDGERSGACCLSLAVLRCRCEVERRGGECLFPQRSVPIGIFFN